MICTNPFDFLGLAYCSYPRVWTHWGEVRLFPYREITHTVYRGEGGVYEHLQLHQFKQSTRLYWITTSGFDLSDLDIQTREFGSYPNSTQELIGAVQSLLTQIEADVNARTAAEMPLSC